MFLEKIMTNLILKQIWLKSIYFGSYWISINVSSSFSALCTHLEHKFNNWLYRKFIDRDKSTAKYVNYTVFIFFISTRNIWICVVKWPQRKPWNTLLSTIKKQLKDLHIQDFHQTIILAQDRDNRRNLITRASFQKN